MKIKKLCHEFFYGLLFLIILSAFILSVGRLLNPFVNSHREDLALIASRLLNTPITIGRVDVGWHDFEPKLSFYQVTLLDKNKSLPLLKVNKIQVVIAIGQSLLTRQIQPDRIIISGVNLAISQPQKNLLKITGFPVINLQNSTNDSSSKVQELLHLFTAQPKLMLQDIAIRWQPWQKNPMTLHFASLHCIQNNNAIFMQGKDISIYDPQIFLNSLWINQLQAKLILNEMQPDGWQLIVNNATLSNADLAASLNLKLSLGKVKTYLDLDGKFNLYHADQVSNYLPLAIFHPHLVNWLRSAFLAGSADSGVAIFHGDVKDFPFKKKQGEFLISAQVKDLTFAYAQNWPIIQHLDAQLSFAGPGMSVQVQHGNIFNINIAQANGAIADLGKYPSPILTVHGLAEGDAKMGLDFLHQSPLESTVGKELSGINLQGPIKLNLDLKIPLLKTAKTQVLGKLALDSVDLSLPDWLLQYDRLTGELEFSKDKISASGLMGYLFGQATQLSLTTKKTSAGLSFVQAAINGQANITAVQTWLHLPATNMVQGQFNYNANLMLASAEQNTLQDDLQIHSDLAGVAINLPPPYAKSVAQKQPLFIDMKMGHQQPLGLKIFYAKLLSAAVQLHSIKNHLVLTGGEIHLGDNRAEFQNQPGLWISGYIPVLNWAAWQNSFPGSGAEVIDFSALAKQLSWLGGIDIKFDQLIIANQQLLQVHLQSMMQNQHRLLLINSQQIIGSIILPNSIDEAINGVFQRLHLLISDAHAVDIKPNKILPLNFSCKDFEINAKNFGAITLQAFPNTQGLMIKKLTIGMPNLQISAHGRWINTDTGTHSYLEGNADSKNATALLKNFGEAKNFSIDTAHAAFNLNWPGKPYQPNFQQIAGNFSLQLGEGRIMQLSDATAAKIGLGRMLNILSLSTLSRRLSLDFSDLFEKGYSFDKMQGNFNIAHGSLETKNTYFDGPIAKINLLGRIGLTAKDYDLIIAIKPYLTSSLPVAATLVGGPIAGIATWVINKVVGGEVSKFSTYNYAVTGSWVDPQWQKISAA